MKSFQNKICENCGSPKLKLWEELTDDQKFLVERLPQNTEYPLEKRKRHRFCVRCWFETLSEMENDA